MASLTLEKLRARLAEVEQGKIDNDRVLREAQARAGGYPFVIGELKGLIEELEQQEKDEQQLAQLEQDAGITDAETPPAPES